MAIITRHSKERIIQRNDNVETMAEAKRMAKQAKNSGKSIMHYQKYPKFFSYLTNKRDQTNECSVRIYHGCIYIWRGKTRKLVTAHPIPQRYIDEMRRVDKCEVLQDK